MKKVSIRMRTKIHWIWVTHQLLSDYKVHYKWTKLKQQRKYKEHADKTVPEWMKCKEQNGHPNEQGIEGDSLWDPYHVLLWMIYIINNKHTTIFFLFIRFNNNKNGLLGETVKLLWKQVCIVSMTINIRMLFYFIRRCQGEWHTERQRSTKRFSFFSFCSITEKSAYEN